MDGERDPSESDPTDIVGAFYEWLNSGRSPTGSDGLDFIVYWRGIAEARYVIRKVTRIVDEQARRAGLDPLEHQALIQIVGASTPRRVSELAERLDIAPALSSRLVRRLESNGLVNRKPSSVDKRSIRVTATARARQVLSQINDAVALHMGYFHQQLSEAERAIAFGMLASYAGASDVAAMDAMIKVAHKNREPTGETTS